MKKKILSLLTAFALLAALIPMGAVTAHAAGHSYSEDAVSFIKSWEGFSATAFWDVSQWTIGYGTNGEKGQTITESEAEAAMRAHMAKLDEKINAFAAKYSLSFSQAQHDALVSFCFNCGTEWMDQEGRFRSAIINKAGGNEFLYAISLWANIASVPDRGLLNRRMSEANLFFNGVYSKEVPYDYSYVIYDANGGTPGKGGEDKMQGYNTVQTAKIAVANPTKSGSTFGGWYTEASGGEYVDVLNASTAGKTLYAQWGTLVKVKDPYVNVRSGAGATYTQVGKKYAGDTMVIVETRTVGEALWGRFGEGWVALQYTDYTGSKSEETEKGDTGTVVCGNYLYIRKGAGTTYAAAGSLQNGAKVEILETKTVNGVQWGRIASGWVCMNYVKMDEKAGDSGSSVWTDNQSENKNDNSKYENGTVTGSGVNVRSAAGVGNKVVVVLNKGTAVKVYEKTTKDNAPWGRIDQGWICLNYVKIADTETGTGTPSSEEIASGIVSTNTNLNVRSGAGTNYAKVKSLSSGTKISIYEKVTVNGQMWGRIDEQNWVCLSYVKLDNSSVSADNSTGKVTSKSGLRIRSAAGTNNAIVGSLTYGSTVTISETTTVSGVKWGRTDKGWVCMDYIQITGNASAGTGISWY